MDIVVHESQTGAPATVVELIGALDASNYLQVIDLVKTIYAKGIKNLVFDLSNLTFMSSSGIFAMHSIALIMKGQQPPNPEDGWGAMHSSSNTNITDSGFMPNFKVVNPQQRVIRTLEVTGFSQWLEVFPTQDMALASFSAGIA